MAGSEQMKLEDITIDPANLYREETYTDLQVGQIRHLIPVTPDGSRDSSRECIYVGHTNVMSNVGPLPIECPIEATTLEEALEKFPEAVQEAFERLIERAKEHQREQASRIVVPGAKPPSIQMP